MLPSLARIPASINKKGILATSTASYMRRNTALFGVRTSTPASKTIAGRFAKAGAPKPKSTQVTIGQSPDGFGKQILWHPDDAQLAVIAFLSAADYLGVMISGVRPNDTIEFVSSRGIASFAEETENKGVGAFIGIIGAGAKVTAAAFGAPELLPVISAAEAFAKSQFEQQEVKTKQRDPFGVDPSSGHKARQEGGVIVSLPEARQIYYSGDSDTENRWIKKPGTRVAANYPDHVKDAFFLRSGSLNLYAAGAEGDIIIAPWDHIFTDNLGYYELHILLKRNNHKPPVVE
jgi:hypothetical protein